MRSKKGSKKVPAALSRLRAIAAIRPEFVGIESVEDLATKGALLALKHARAQAASVFLFDQLGRLTRMVLVGWDKEGSELNNSSVSPEHHLPGQSFTGKVAIPPLGSPFGEAQWSNALDSRVDILTRKEYTRVLGTLRAAVSLPLNGNHRTFGVLEVINKAGAQGSFHFEDAHWLSLIANELALSISQTRRARTAEILHQLAEAVVSMFVSTTEEEGVYRSVARALTRPPLPYRVCIIRLRTGEELTTVAAEAFDVPLLDRDESPLQSSHGLAGVVLKTGNRIYVRNIARRDPSVDCLKNWDWAIRNNLVSYACVPLMIEEEVVGTLSLYFGFEFTIDGDEWDFLESLARFLAAFYNGRRVLSDVEKMVRQDAIDAATAEYDNEPDKHTFAEFLNGVLAALDGIRGENLGTITGKKEHDRVFAMIEAKLDQVRKEISDPEIVDLNELIASIVSTRKRIPMKTHIQFATRLRKVPLILARASALRHVVKDLIANAVKSIQRKNAGFGLVTIETRLGKDKEGAERIELIIEDTGEGIPREDWERIFERGFTTYQDGTGLGLSLARSVLTSLSGSIRVASSTVGEGSIFHVVFQSGKALKTIKPWRIDNGTV